MGLRTWLVLWKGCRRRLIPLRPTMRVGPTPFTLLIGNICRLRPGRGRPDVGTLDLVLFVSVLLSSFLRSSSKSIVSEFSISLSNSSIISSPSSWLSSSRLSSTSSSSCLPAWSLSCLPPSSSSCLPDSSSSCLRVSSSSSSSASSSMASNLFLKS